MKLIPDEDNPLLSNRSAASFVKESELEIIAHRDMPIDLRTIPRERWEEFLNFQLAIPPRLLDGFDPGPIPVDSIHALEEAVDRFHGITAPFAAMMDTTLQYTGKAWSYVPEAAEFLTGFTLGFDDCGELEPLRKDAKP